MVGFLENNNGQVVFVVNKYSFNCDDDGLRVQTLSVITRHAACGLVPATANREVSVLEGCSSRSKAEA